MNDTVYRVLIDCQLRGGENIAHAAHGLEDLKSHLGSLGGLASSAGSQLAGAFTGTVEAVGAMTAAFAGGAIVAGIHQVVDGIVNINNQLEKTQIAIADIFNSRLGGGMTNAMKMSGDVIGQMRRDAAALPGEFKDLVAIFQGISGSGLRAGMGVQDIRKMSALAMAAGATAMMPMDQVGRELTQLLEGHAGGHNVLGQRVFGLTGEASKKFNHMEMSKRPEFLMKEFEKHSESLKVYERSWDAISSTFRQNITDFKQAATAVVFERMKDALSKVNTWFDNNRDTIALWADRISVQLTNAFDAGVKAIHHWYPAVRNFAEHLYSEISGAWKKIEPLGGKVLEGFHKFLDDPQAIHKLENVLKMYAGVKIGGALGGVGGDLLKGAGGIGQAVGSMGGGEAMLGLITNPVALAAAAGTAVVAIGALVMSVVQLYGAFHALTDKTSEFHASAVVHWERAQAAGDRAMEKLGRVFEKVEPGLIRFADMMGNDLLFKLDAAASSLLVFASALETVANKAQLLANYGKHISKNEASTYEHGGQDMSARIGAAALANMDAAATAAAAKAPKSGGGGGGTSVQKVEIVVTSNQDPSRIARTVLTEIQNIARHPKVSRNVPNYAR